MLTTQENSFIQTIFDDNKIPLWIFSPSFSLQDSFFYDLPNDLKVKLSFHVNQLIEKSSTPDFDLMCYENELYYIFSFERNHECYYLFGGPMLLSSIHQITDMKTLSFGSHLNMRELSSLVEKLPVISLNSFRTSLRMMMQFLRNSALSLDEISNCKFSNLKESLNHSLASDLFYNMEDYRIHTPYRQEIALLNCIKEGNVAKLESLYRTLPETKYGNMTNNSNPIRQLFYGSIANTTLATRFAIEGGLDEETAFTLSDIYIKRMEHCTTLFELNLLNEKMAIDFTEHVMEAKTLKKTKYTQPITKSIDYIFSNLHTKITLSILAKEVNTSPKYLSFLFHKETGQTISSFIVEAKINRAKNLLIYSEFSYSDISQYLLFHSQSYFIAIFKKLVGMTPKKYRNLYSKSKW